MLAQQVKRFDTTDLTAQLTRMDCRHLRPGFYPRPDRSFNAQLRVVRLVAHDMRFNRGLHAEVVSRSRRACTSQHRTHCCHATQLNLVLLLLNGRLVAYHVG